MSSKEQLTTEKIKKQTEAALLAIENAIDTPEQEYGVTMFIDHHIDEIDTEYWVKHLNTNKPAKRKILDLLVLQEHWDDGCVFDFTLPGDITNYVISVQFDEDGEIQDITMES